MLVDPAILRALAGATDDAAEAVVRVALPEEVRNSCHGMPGSSLQWAARALAGEFDGRVDVVSAMLDDASRGVSGAGETYRVAEDDLTMVFRLIASR